MKSTDPRELSVRGCSVAHDFSQTAAFAALLMKRKWFKPVFGSSCVLQATEQIALCTVFVVTYARPFSQNRGRSFPLKPRGLGQTNEICIDDS